MAFNPGFIAMVPVAILATPQATMRNTVRGIGQWWHLARLGRNDWYYICGKAGDTRVLPHGFRALEGQSRVMCSFAVAPQYSVLSSLGWMIVPHFIKNGHEGWKWRSSKFLRVLREHRHACWRKHKDHLSWGGTPDTGRWWFERSSHFSIYCVCRVITSLVAVWCVIYSHRMIAYLTTL